MQQKRSLRVGTPTTYTTFNERLQLEGKRRLGRDDIDEIVLFAGHLLNAHKRFRAKPQRGQVSTDSRVTSSMSYTKTQVARGDPAVR